MKPLTQLIGQILSRTEHDWQIKLRAEWSTIMGDLSRRARLERVNGSTVIIGVYDSHWMHELHALSRMMLQRMNSALHALYPEGFMLTSIRCIWVIKKESKNKKYLASFEQAQKPLQKKPSLQAIKTVQKLADKELQNSLLAYYQRCKDSL
ncbi:MAG: DUF721 domain-containing protein [Candidatus Babeliaceae bacterium]|nr:DUF721 domain-containing protein [Candidatus Babeliaceae bacterium]